MAKENQQDIWYAGHVDALKQEEWITEHFALINNEQRGRSLYWDRKNRIPLPLQEVVATIRTGKTVVIEGIFASVTQDIQELLFPAADISHPQQRQAKYSRFTITIHAGPIKPQI